MVITAADEEMDHIKAENPSSRIRTFLGMENFMSTPYLVNFGEKCHNRPHHLCNWHALDTFDLDLAK
jgi:hypothetical protein